MISDMDYIRHALGVCGDVEGVEVSLVQSTMSTSDLFKVAVPEGQTGLIKVLRNLQVLNVTPLPGMRLFSISVVIGMQESFREEAKAAGYQELPGIDEREICFGTL